MSNELPWSERVNMLSINPDAASRDDIARLATEVGEFQRKELAGRFKSLGDRKMSKRLHEFVGYRKYAIVIAADSMIAAKDELLRLGDNWENYADDIGFDSAEDLELVDVRDPKAEDLQDEAHRIV